MKRLTLPSIRSEVEVEELADGDRITPVTVENGEVTIGYHGIGCMFYD